MTSLPKKSVCSSKSVNPITSVTPVLTATLYALENLQGDLPIVRQILAHCERGQFDTVKELCDEFTRPEFRSTLAYKRRKQFTALLTKVPFAGSEEARRRRAFSDFVKAEKRCKIANKRLRYFKARLFRLPTHYQHIIADIRKEIQFLMGPLNDNVMGAVLEKARPGPGQTVGTRDCRLVSLPWKYAETDLVSTPDAKPYAMRLLKGAPLWASTFVSERRFDKDTNGKLKVKVSFPIEVTQCSKITFVPKDARTLRTIAIEPSLNVMLQLGVHEYLSSRLTRLGNSITDQTRNQLLAKWGSELWEDPTSSMATLDLSSASDSISLGLCELLLPEDWLALLLDLRCPQGKVKMGKENHIVTFEKISSMGNGYTFVLETIIFLAIARVCTAYVGGGSCKPSAYGDDIIVPTGAYAITVEMLKFFGFTTNVSKTYAFGPFRESCGADWHCGEKVTPVYLRTDKLRVTDVYNLRNQLLATGHGVSVVERYLKQCVQRVTTVLYGLRSQDSQGCWFIDPGDLRAYVRRKAIVWDSYIQNWNWRVIRWVEHRYMCSNSWSYLASLKGMTNTQARLSSKTGELETFQSRKRAGEFRYTYAVRVPKHKEPGR
jgi:hypothetical protein